MKGSLQWSAIQLWVGFRLQQHSNLRPNDLKQEGWSLGHLDASLTQETLRIVSSRQVHDINITSPQRRCNVMTLHRRWGDVIFTSCARWGETFKQTLQFSFQTTAVFCQFINAREVTTSKHTNCFGWTGALAAVKGQFPKLCCKKKI